jgi:hypothetical protein
VFGKDFPRSLAVRREILDSFHGAAQADSDRLDHLSDRFYASLPHREKKFDAAADRWLREVCGIENLHDTVEGRTRH